MKKIKNILFEIDLIGQGTVNMDSKDQQWPHINEKTMLKPGMQSGDNVVFAKKNFYRDENGKLNWKLKISSDCLSKSAFQQDILTYSPKASHDDFLLYSYLFSTASLVKGWMNATKKETIKRKGALSLCDAQQTNNAVSYLEFYTRSGEKIEKDPDTGKSVPSIFTKETVGDMTYATQGNIDLMQLQFVSCDQALDRYSFNPDKFELIKTFLKMRLPNFDSELGYYMIKNTVLEIPEHGFLLSSENVAFLVKETLKRLLAIHVKRRTAFAKTNALRIKLVDTPTINTHSSKDGWIELTSNSDIDKLDFIVEDFYEQYETSKAITLRESIEAAIVKSKGDAADDAKEKKRLSAERKLKKNIEANETV